MLQTLATLPIPNKTMLQDTKVLPTVEKWSVKSEVPMELDSGSNSPKLETESLNAREGGDGRLEKIGADQKIKEVEKDKGDEKIKADEKGKADEKIKTEEKGEVSEIKTEIKVEDGDDKFKIRRSVGMDVESPKAGSSQPNSKASETIGEIIEMFDEDDEVFENIEIRLSVGMDIENIREKRDGWGESKPKSTDLVEQIIDMFEDDLEPSDPPNKQSHLPQVVPKEAQEEQRDYPAEIIALALKLIEEWTNLKEVFRIPKKERIEQMKEHEREANRGYKSGAEHDLDKNSLNRYRGIYKIRKMSSDEANRRKQLKSDDTNRNLSQLPKITKQERRMLFALQVEQEEVRIC